MNICEKDQCTGCGACQQICPKNSIYFIEDEDGFIYPDINNDSCINCHMCEKHCHNNLHIQKHDPEYYMGWHKSLDVLKNSSSGGAFTAISNLILEHGGVVFGAFLDKATREIHHIAIEESDLLYQVRLSKYYQGTIDNSYKKAKEFLESGRLVLFTGTSCQIAGLYAFLNKDYPNLYTADVLCHGITNKTVVDQYIKSKEKYYKKTILTFRFRVKPDDSPWQWGGGVQA